MAFRKLPTITGWSQLLPYLKLQQQSIDPILRRVAQPKVPWNFRVTKKRNGLLLDWSTVKGADGYELLRSNTADFESPVEIPIRNWNQNSYFDSLGGSATTRYYKIRATAGTLSAPFAVKGPTSGIVTDTSIDSTDTTTQEATTYDTTTDDTIQSDTRHGIPL